MKQLFLLLLVFSTNETFASGLFARINELVSSDLTCEESVTPTIRKGEVKISYPCDTFPPENPEKEKITFFEPRDASRDTGLIIRRREGPKGNDFTVKFRPDSGAEMDFDEDLYALLKDKDDSSDGAIKFKCEADAVFGAPPKVTESCSLRTHTTSFTLDYQTFMQMVGRSAPNSIEEYVGYEIQSSSWEKEFSGLDEPISFEKWEMKNTSNEELCLLEVSTKFEVSKNPQATLSQRMEGKISETLEKLRQAFPLATPSSEQGNKTSRALSFLKGSPQ